MYLFYYVSISLPTLYSCLVRKLIQKHLNISIQRSKKDPFGAPLTAQICPKMHGLAYKISKKNSGTNTPEPPLREGASGPIRRPPNVEHKSAPRADIRAEWIVHFPIAIYGAWP